MANYFQRLCGLMRKAIVQYDMLQDGDKVCVGVSGGKDSVALTLALAQLQKYIDIKFDLVAVTLDPQFYSKPTDYSRLEELFREKGIEYVIKRTDIGPIIFDQRKEENPCSLCARMRRGALHDVAKELGCNKIALGHHLDDAIETFYMNLWNEGRIGTFSPVTYLSRKDVTMIRPMALAVESDVVAAVNQMKMPVVKSACPADGVTNRQNMKDFITEKCKTDPSFRAKSLNAFQKKDLDGWGPKKKI
ncbi:MAG: tRNA 2-thiocytidine(32) synthetase TtcA [Oscillospiraceae bacterium]|nr:tRNA 2-thiocytidine(32) synthetase TtcA [Oscillospiraceae bacterium]MBQ6849914.1 tRNA 2-thiocytidine(32) synthetase TtcA [Oscillospiraceae bacterium]